MPALLDWLSFLTQAAYYLACLLLIGLSINQAMSSSSSRQFKSLQCKLVLLAAFLFVARLLLVNGELGGGPGSVFNPATFRWVWAVHAVQAWVFLTGLVTVLLNLWLRHSSVYLLAALVLSSSFTLSGHTQALDEPGLWPWAGALHVLIAGFWIAAPIVLWPGRAVESGELAQRCELFSRVAMLTIPVLFLAGAFLALRLAGGWDGLVESVYGRLLLFKLLFAILALSVGVFNKFHVVKLLSSEFAKGQQYLRTTLKIDAFIFMIIIGLIAWATTINGPQNL